MNLAPRALGRESGQRLLETGRMHRAPVDIHVIGIELALMAGFRQSDGIEDVERNAVVLRGARHLPLAQGSSDDAARLRARVKRRDRQQTGPDQSFEAEPTA